MSRPILSISSSITSGFMLPDLRMLFRIVPGIAPT